MKIEIKEFHNEKFHINVSHFQLENPDGVVVVFPGAGYSHMGPCLYYPSNLFLENNYEVVNLEYDFRKNRLENETQAGYAEYFEFLSGVIQELKLHSNKIALSKSIGTRILGSKEDVIFKKKIWLTPALKNQFVIDSISSSTENSLVIIGTSDPFYDKEVLSEIVNSGVICYEIAGADHGLDINGNTFNTLNEMKNIIRYINNFIFAE